MLKPALASLVLFSLPSFAATAGAVRCGRLLDVKAGTYTTDAVVLFEDGVITASGST